MSQKPETKSEVTPAPKPEPRGLTNRCGGCSHWKAFATSAPEVTTGRCYLNPPVLDPGNSGGASETPGFWIWPVTMAQDGCGSWLKIEEAPVAERKAPPPQTAAPRR